MASDINLPICCIACRNESQELHEADENQINIYKEFLGGKVPHGLIDNSCKYFCSMCRFKLIDFENFKNICMKTLQSFAEVLEINQNSDEIHTENMIIECVKDEYSSFNYELDQTDYPTVSVQKTSTTSTKKRGGRPKKEDSLRAPEKVEDIENEVSDGGGNFMETEYLEDSQSNDGSEVLAKHLKKDKNRGRGRPTRKLSNGNNKEDVDIGFGLEFHENNTKTFKNAKHKEMMEQIENTFSHHLKLDAANETWCSICSMDVSTKFFEHLMSNHFIPHGKQFQCLVCHETMPASQFMVHFEEHREFREFQKCHQCELEFNDSKSFREHIETDHSNYKYKCKKCSEEFQKRNDIQHHVLSEHMEMFVCEFCWKIFTISTDLDEHLQSHSLQSENKNKVVTNPKKLINLPGKTMKYGEFCRKILRKIYPKPPRKTNDLSTSKLDTFCQICNAEVKPYRRHLTEIHFIAEGSNKFTCRLCRATLPTMNQAVTHFDGHRNFSPPQMCSLCDKTFTNMKPLKRHMIVHNNSGAYPCPECKNCYNCRNALNYHIISIHLNKYVCNNCYQVFDEEKGYRVHLETEKKKLKAIRSRKKTEPVSEEETDAENQVEEEKTVLKIEPVEEQKPKIMLHGSFGLTFCCHCNETIRDYTNHFATVHATLTEDNRLECKECLQIISQKYAFLTHFRKFHKRYETPKTCPHCPEEFHLVGDYERHITTHKEAKMFECHFCGKSYVNKQMLRYHIINNYTDKKCCPYCTKTFDNEAEFKIHTAQERAKRKRHTHVCDICGFSTNHKRYMASHIIRLHSSKSVACDECGKVCKTKLNLKDHKLNVHREKKALCTICGGKFRNQCFLKYHIDKSHSDQKTPCTECGKEVHPSLMKRHIYFKHSTLRPFECKVCSMDFKNKSGLQKHLHTHTGTRPFNCHLCAQGYYNRELLQKHYLNAHGTNYSTEEMRFSKRVPSTLEKSMMS